MACKPGGGARQPHPWTNTDYTYIMLSLMMRRLAHPLLFRLRGAQCLSTFVIIDEGAKSFELPRDKLSATFSRSSGAGGQNVNKVSTKADVRFTLADADWLAPPVRTRFATLFPAVINAAGEVFVSSQRHRTQESNLADALDKLTSMVRRATIVPKVRATRTALSELTKVGYRDDKRFRSVLKEKRRGPSFGDGDGD